MRTTHATQIARSFIERYNANDIAGALALLADDVQYWLAGKPDQLGNAGTRNKQQMAELFERMTQRQQDGQRMWVKNTVTEGDQVAMEVESRATLKNGRLYNNEYHMLFKVNAQGRIALVKEYYDTYHVWNVWYRSDDKPHQEPA